MSLTFPIMHTFPPSLTYPPHTIGTSLHLLPLPFPSILKYPHVHTHTQTHTHVHIHTCTHTLTSIYTYTTLTCAHTHTHTLIAGNFREVQISFFSFSVYQNKTLTHEMYIMMGVFSSVKSVDRMKSNHTNQLEIAI